MATIPLQIQTPQIVSPLETVGGLMKLRSSIVENALRAAQIQQSQAQMADIQAQAQQRQRDVADQNTIQELMKDPATAGQIAGGDMLPLYGKVQPKTIDAVLNNVTNRHKELSTIAEMDLKNRQTAYQTLGKDLDNLSQLGDVDAINSALPSFIQNHGPELKVLGLDPGKAPTQITSPDDLKSYAAYLSVGNQMTTAALDRKKEQAGIGLSEAQTGEIKQKVDLLAQQIAATKKLQDPESAAAIVSSVIPNNHRLYQGALGAVKNAAATNPGKPEAATEALRPYIEKYIAEQQAGPEAAARIAGETPAKVAQETALIGPRAAGAAAETRSRQAAEVSAFPPEFRGAGTAEAARQSQSDFRKDTNEYTDSIKGLRLLNNFVKAAESGNKAAPGLISIEELRQFINRPNVAELKGVGGGNFWDKVEGAINGFEKGEPVPPAVLHDLKGVIGQIGSGLVENYQQKVETNKKTYGTNPQPVDIRFPGQWVQHSDVPKAISDQIPENDERIVSLADGRQLRLRKYQGRIFEISE